MTNILLSSLCRSNIGVLSQKLALIDALVSCHGLEQSRNIYKSMCPIVGASIGQHVRHSLDHMELVVAMASTLPIRGPNNNLELHYDLRVRGVTSEHNMDEARKRIENIMKVLQKIPEDKEQEENATNQSVFATFMLAGDGHEYKLSSTVGRELAFAAHHAVHHMAIIKVIATETAGLSASELPADFGRAPSTINFDKTQAHSAK